MRENALFTLMAGLKFVQSRIGHFFDASGCHKSLYPGYDFTRWSVELLSWPY